MAREEKGKRIGYRYRRFEKIRISEKQDRSKGMGHLEKL
jgi:hypothetical protein